MEEKARRFLTPDTVQDAYQALSAAEGKTVILAGGVELLPRWNRKKIQSKPDTIVYLGKLGLDYIKEEGDQVVIGACATHTQVLKSDLIKKFVPLLIEVTEGIAFPAVRNSGTIGGNICNRAATSDTLAAMLALDAELVVEGLSGKRMIPTEEFLNMSYAEALPKGVILKEIRIPKQKDEEKNLWFKQGQRKGNSRSVASMAISLKFEGDIVKKARIAIGAVETRPFVSQCSNLIEGQKLSAQNIETLSKAIMNSVKAREDSRANANYRKSISGTMARQLLSGLI